MASRGRGRLGSGRSNSPRPPAFDQQVFIETIGSVTATIAQVSVVTATIARTSATGSQRGSSKFKRFKVHHPPIFRGGGDPMVANHWFRQVKNIVEAMEITSDATNIKLAVFQLLGKSQVWWD